ncbi:sensor histidine kinase [Rhodocaloribacter sp.]
MPIVKRYLGLLFVLCWPAQGQAQTHVSVSENGFVLSENAVHFSPEVYGAYHQNWAVTQDRRGVVYVANRDGVLEYDGVEWRLIRTATTVRSLAADARGGIYGGLQGDFGYLKPDSLGVLRFVSLLPEVDPSARDFKDVWGTHVAPDGIYFQTGPYVFLWDGKRMKHWSSTSRFGFGTSFVVHGRFFVREAGVGLKENVGGDLRLVKGGDRFAKTRIYVMVPYDKNKILIVTREEGAFLYDGISFFSFPTEIDSYLRQFQLYHGAALPGHMFALATLGGGVVIIDAQGRLVEILDQPDELPDGVVNYVYPDAEGGLWLALHNSGIMRIAAPSKVTRFDSRLGLEGAIYDIVRHRDTLYVTTQGSAGLYRLNPIFPLSERGHQRSSFGPVTGVPRSWTMASADSVLFVATDEGVYRVSGREGHSIETKARASTYVLLKSEAHPALIYVGRRDGLELLRYTEAGWRLKPVEGVEEDIRSMVEEEDGTLWIGTKHEGVLRLRFDEGLDAPPRQERFGALDGLVEKGLTVIKVGGRPLFFSDRDKRLLRYREDVWKEEPRFFPDPELMALVAVAQDTLKVLKEDDAGNVWMAYNDRVEVAVRQPEGGYARRKIPSLRFPRMNIETIYAEASTTWLSSGNTLLRYNAALDRSEPMPPRVMVRRMVLTGRDSLIFGGAFVSTGEGVSMHQDAASVPVLAPDEKDVEFDVAAPSFTHPEEVLYQYFLEGRDETWSAWAADPRQAYYGLKPGVYRFHVRARNVQGEVGKEAVFAFRILPPWYQTWWAYTLYLLAGSALLWFTWKYVQMVQAHRLAKQQAVELARERLVNERLQQANAHLQVANERLKQANKLKDEFLATTSHELRTPLTAILGFTEVLKYEVPEDAPYREFLGIIEESGNRLMQTLTSLLEIAKLRAGVLDINLEPVDLARQAQDVVRMLSELARKKGLELELVPPPEPLYAMLDEHAYERILSNLIGNAVKFTEKGQVVIGFERAGDQVRVHIQDTGIGIAETFLPHLFEEFRQESDGLSRSHEGTGLGLAITARLVKLMNGEITVQSHKGKGSIFTVSFPAHEPKRAPKPGSRSLSSGDGWPSGTVAG